MNSPTGRRSALNREPTSLFERGAACSSGGAEIAGAVVAAGSGPFPALPQAVTGAATENTAQRSTRCTRIDEKFDDRITSLVFVGSRRSSVAEQPARNLSRAHLNGVRFAFDLRSICALTDPRR